MFFVRRMALNAWCATSRPSRKRIFSEAIQTGAGQYRTLKEIANELSNRLIKIWLRNENQERPFTRASVGALDSEHDRDQYLFHEYFNGDTGAGLGAGHQ